MRFAFLISTLLFYSILNCSAYSIGNGTDGSTISGIVNSYASLVRDAKKCDDQLYLSDASAFKAGDLIIVIQMQNAVIDGSNSSSYGTILSYGNCGNYEYAGVQSVDGNILHLKYALVNNYDVAGKTQVVRVPQYQNAIVTSELKCPAWDGSTGGVIAIDVQGSLQLQAYVNASGKGFRGGEAQSLGVMVMVTRPDYIAEPDPTYYALKGEGIAGYGTGTWIAGRGAPANGGGGGNVHTTGGGGGSNGGCGGDGGWGYPVDTFGNEKLIFGLGGYPLGYSGANKVFMGGGGGAGHEHTGNGTSGGNGGGIVFITCDAIDGNNFAILATGDGSASSGAGGDGAGGAGAGGTVLISSSTYTSSLPVIASGGNSGSTILKGFGPGGGGGGGIVWIDQASQPSQLVTTLTGGIAGKAGGIPYGATNGCDGAILFNWLPDYNSTSPAVHAAFTLSSQDKRTIALQNQSTGATKYLWHFGNGSSDSTVSPKYHYPQTGFYRVALKASNGFCSDSTSQIFVTETANVFTPNNDHLNDTFFSFSSFDQSLHIELSIFNRWGNLVFKTESSEGWNGDGSNGNPTAEGTYFYIATLRNLETQETFTEKGTVSLIR